MSPEPQPQRTTLMDELFKLRDRQRQRAQTGRIHIHRRDLSVERNTQGIMRWYLHPAIDDTVLKTLIVFEQEIPPGSRSGKLKCPGGQVIRILEGRGHTVLDGIRHPWEKGDIVNIPIRTEGVVLQHFNDDPDRQVRLLSVEPNLTDPLGVDGGSEFEQLEVSPDYP